MRRLLRELRNIYRYYRVPRRQWHRNDVLNAIGNLVQWRGVSIRCLDAVYQVPTQDGFLRTLAALWEQQRAYTRDEYDCENFAVWFWAWAAGLGMTSIGIVVDISGAHAYNVVVVDFEGVLVARFFEPQTGEFVDRSHRSGLYQANDALALVG